MRALLDVIVPSGQVDLQIDSGRIRVCFDTIGKSPFGRFYRGFSYFAFAAGIFCLPLFAPGKNNAPSMWQDICACHLNSFESCFPFCFVVAMFGFLVWYLSRVMPVMYPGAQTLECDETKLTISRLRWLDWRNKEWITESYLLADVSRIRYGVLASSRGGNSVYGLRLRAAGRNYKLFPRLTTPQVGRLLRGLEALGVDTERRRKARGRK